MHRRNAVPIVLCLLAVLAFVAAFPRLIPRAIQPRIAITEHRVTNKRDVAASISWVTDVAAVGQVRFGPTTALGATADDERGAGIVSDTHYVNLGSLNPGTIYYYDIILDNGAFVDDNNGAHYSFATGPLLSPITPETAFGEVRLADGASPAAGAVVYFVITDNDGVGSPGQSAPLSALVEASGYWSLALNQARLPDLSQRFQYGGNDLVQAFAQGGSQGAAQATFAANAIAPAPILQLSGPAQTPTPTASASPSATNSPTLTPSATPSVTPSPTGALTPTSTASPTPVEPPTPTPTVTPSRTPVPIDSPTPTPTGSPPSRFLWEREAEAAQLAPALAVRQAPDASGCAYVQTVSAWTNVGAVFAFEAPKDDLYWLWARVMGTSYMTNSFSVSLDGGAAFHYEIQPLQGVWTWTWEVVHVDGQPEAPFALAKGPHTFAFLARELDARLDVVVLTDDASYRPDVSAPCAPAPTPTATNTTTPTQTSTRTPTPSATPTQTVVPSPTSTPSASATPSPSFTPTPTRTPSPTLTPSFTPSPTASPTPTPACSDAYEPDDGVDTAKELIAGAPQSHTFHLARDVDTVHIQLPFPQTFTVFTTVQVYGPDTGITLLAADGSTPLAFNDDEPERAPGSRLTWRGGNETTYYLRVRALGPAFSGCQDGYLLALQTYPRQIWLVRQLR